MRNDEKIEMSCTKLLVASIGTKYLYNLYPHQIVCKNQILTWLWLDAIRRLFGAFAENIFILIRCCKFCQLMPTLNIIATCFLIITCKSLNFVSASSSSYRRSLVASQNFSWYEVEVRTDVFCLLDHRHH